MLSTLFIIALLTALAARVHYLVAQHTQLVSLSSRQVSRQAAAFDDIMSLEAEINEDQNNLRYCLLTSENLTSTGSLYQCPGTIEQSTFTHRNGSGRTYWSGEKIRSGNCRSDNCRLVNLNLGPRTFIEDYFQPEQALTFSHEEKTHRLTIRNHADLSNGITLNDNELSEIVSAGNLTYDPRTIYMGDGAQLLLKSEFGLIYEKQDGSLTPRGKQITFPESATAAAIDTIKKGHTISLTIR